MTALYVATMVATASVLGVVGAAMLAAGEFAASVSDGRTQPRRLLLAVALLIVFVPALVVLQAGWGSW